MTRFSSQVPPLPRCPRISPGQVGRVIGLLAFACLLAGCSRANPAPEVKVTSVIGRSAPCAACEKKIPNVTDKNTYTYQGVQYVVCNKQCAEDVRQWIDSLDER